MSREDYIAMTDEELNKLILEGDTEASYYLQVRHSSSVYYGVPKTCGKFKADLDYYGTVEVSNR